MVSREQKTNTHFNRNAGWASNEDRASQERKILRFASKYKQKSNLNSKVKSRKKSPLTQKLAQGDKQKDLKKMKDYLNKKSLSPEGIKHMRNARNAAVGTDFVKLNKRPKIKSMKPG